MTDVTETISLPEPWALAAAQMPQLFKSLTPPLGAPILLMVSGLHAQATVLVAAAMLDASVVTMPAHSAPEGVRKVIAQTQPYAVVCAPEIFGWVSKLAFLGGCLAIYTCGEVGEGTLLDRASHCTPDASSAPILHCANKRLCFDEYGQPIA